MSVHFSTNTLISSCTFRCCTNNARQYCICPFRDDLLNRLATDDSKRGQQVRDRFIRGEVAHSTNEISMEQRITSKFRKLGISLQQLPHEAVQSDSSDAISVQTTLNTYDTLLGKQLYHKIAPRIRSVLSQSCAPQSDTWKMALSASTTAITTTTFASQVVTSFESYLVSLTFANSKKDVSSEGYPPQQPQNVYDLFKQILSSPPHIVIRRRSHASYDTKHWHGVLVPTVHFYFPVEDDITVGYKQQPQEKERAKSSAFCRILLYAVCQFHGLEASSYVITSAGKRGQSRHPHSPSGFKVVTVQGGVLLAPTLKMLDYID